MAENEDERFAIRISHDSYKFNNTGDVIEIEATKFLQKGGFGITYSGIYRQYLGKLDRTVVAERKVTIKEFFMSNNVCRRNESDNSVVVQDSERFNYFRSKFDKEASALSEINRLQNIAHVIHIFEDNNTSYYVMDYIEGCDLYTYIEKHGPFKSLKEAWSYLRPVCECLQKVHEKGIIHCDIAPNNIIVEPTKDAGGINKFVLIDFGSCRSWDIQTDEGANFTIASHTPYNPYFSPLELVNRGEYSARYPDSTLEKIKVSADIYSLGAVLYYMLAGNSYLKKSERESLRCSKSGTPYAKCRDLILNDFDFPSTMEKEAIDLIKKIMQPVAEDRIQSVKELIKICDKDAMDLERENILKKNSPEKFEILDCFLSQSKDIIDISSRFNYEELNSKAIKGDAEALFYMGESHRKGLYNLTPNYKEAYSWYLKAANLGHPKAQYVVGYYHYLGLKKEFPKDLELAAIWIKKAAENGNTDAMGLLSVMYSKGEGVPRDDIESANWSKRELTERIKEKTGEEVHIEVKDREFLFNETKKQAEKGNAFFQHNLGVMYFNGDGVAKDDSKALEWLRKAAVQGNKQAIETLKQVEGLIEKKKQDNNKHDEKNNPNSKADDWEGFLKKCREDVPLKQTVDNLRQVEGEKKMRKKIPTIWKYIGITIVFLIGLTIYEMFSGNLLYMMGKKLYVNGKYELAENCLLNSVKHGNEESNYLLGSMYIDGNRTMDGIDDLVKVTEWLKKAVDSGVSIAKEKYAKACDSLGGQYYINKDSVQAFNYYKIAAELNNASGQNHLGVLYALGYGTEKNDEEAVKWYQKAADQGFVWGMHNLGTHYRWGNGVPQDKQEAIKWYQMAAERNNVSSMVELGNLYKTIPLYKEYFKWYQKAAENENTDAQYRLGRDYQYGYHDVPQDYNKALYWYKKAAGNGDWDSERAIGDAYYYGEESDNSYTNYSLGFKKDWVQAVKWYSREDIKQKYKDTGYPSNFKYISERLGDMYKNGGYGLKSDLQKAKEWYKIAADKGSTSARTKLEKLN